MRPWLRFLVLGRWFDPEDVFARPLLGAGEPVPSKALCPDPASEVLALMHDLARRPRKHAAGLKVLADEVEGALPFHGPGGAPGRVDVLQLLAPLLRQRPGAGVGSRVLQPDADLVAPVDGVQRCQEVPVLLGPPTRRGEPFFPGDVVVRPDHAQLLQLLDAFGVQATAGVSVAGVGDPLSEGKVCERGWPLLRHTLAPFFALTIGLLLPAVGHAVRERDLQAAVEPGVDDGRLHTAPPVLLLGVEDTQADERRERGRIARGAELQQRPRRHRDEDAVFALGALCLLASCAAWDVFGAAGCLWHGQCLHDAGVVRPEGFQELGEPAVGLAREHVVRGFPGGPSRIGTTSEATFPSPVWMRRARPTAWTRSGMDPRTSAKYTLSQLWMSTPSPRTFADPRKCLAASAPPANSSSTRRRWAGG